ncbi:probable gamma-glutamylcyclotransferase [Coccomyxa sp. Obi]|nr:probable gamma-glutamylcyclotransferase [Coccomyxa sp. Obi]
MLPAASSSPVLPSDAVLYFAYGANLSGQIIQKRGAHPITWEPARVTSLSLGFAHRGGYATLIEHSVTKASEDPDFRSLNFFGPHGVLYTLSTTDFQKIASRETGYDITRLDVRTYAGRMVSARAFQSQRLLRLKESLPPRQQYLDLMLHGAKEHGLCEDYCQWLGAVPSVAQGTPLGPEYFDTPSEVLAKLAAVSLAVAGGVWAAGHGGGPRQ